MHGLAARRDGFYSALSCRHPDLRLPHPPGRGDPHEKSLGHARAAGGMTAVLSENLSAPREIRAFNLEDVKQEVPESSGKFFEARMKVIKYANMLTPIIEIITATGIAVAIFQASRKSIHLDAVIPVIVPLPFLRTDQKIGRNSELL